MNKIKNPIIFKDDEYHCLVESFMLDNTSTGDVSLPLNNIFRRQYYIIIVLEIASLSIDQSIESSTEINGN